MKLSLAILAVFACSLSQPAWLYAEFPSRPVKLVVGYAPGDRTDLVARIMVPVLTQYFKQRVYIDNHAGASGNVAAALVAKARPDGHTLLIVPENFSTSVSIYPNIAYDPQRDFAPVALLARFDNVLVVNTSSRLATLSELLARIRANPGHVAIASAGTGSTSHLAAEMMKVRAGWLNALHVPYRANVYALADVLGAHVHAHVATVGSAYPHVRTGRLRALAVTSAKRSRVLPEVPTFDESGFPGFEASAWMGAVAPAGTPYDAVVRLNLALGQVLDTPAVRERLAAQGAQPVVMPYGEFAQFLHSEVERWAKVVKEAGIALE